MGKMTGNEFLVKALQEEGVEKIFGYPGACVIDIFDEIYKQDQVELILPRHEQGLIHAADGYARATGKVGVCLATSGPGATNLVTGIATANYDSVPLVCFTGQVATNLIGNDTFQEIDIVGVTRNIAKFVIVVRKREDLNRLIKEAFYIANTGKKGPVVVDLPKDIMLEEGDDLYPKEVKIRSYKPSKGVHIGQLKKANSLLSQAKKPLFLMGGGVNISGANEEAKKLAKSSGLEGKELTYIYNSDRANMESVATVVQQQLAEIGVTVNIESCDTSTFFPRFFASKDKELATTWDLGTNGWDSQRGSNCGQAISYFTNRLCDCGYSDEVSGLAQKAIGTADAKEKQELWNTIQDKALEECWEYPLTYTNFVMVSQKNVTGLDGSSVVPEFIDYLSIHMD